MDFSYKTDDSKSDELGVSVMISDEAMIGTTMEVYLVGYGLNSSDFSVWGTNGTSPNFNIIVSDEEADQTFVVSPNQAPTFEQFPSNIEHTMGSEPSTVSTSALAVDTDGFINSISVDVGTAIGFVKAEGATDSVSF